MADAAKNADAVDIAERAALSHPHDETEPVEDFDQEMENDSDLKFCQIKSFMSE